jgi:hypothetical protein
MIRKRTLRIIRKDECVRPDKPRLDALDNRLLDLSRRQHGSLLVNAQKLVLIGHYTDLSGASGKLSVTFPDLAR